MHFIFPRFFTIWSALAFLFAVCVASGPAWAEQGIVTPGIQASTSYNDNVHFKKRSDFEWLVTPSVDAEYGQEDWTVSSGMRADIYRYSELTDYDRENYSFWAEGSRDFSETLELNCRGTFSYDHTFTSELAESGNITGQALRRNYSLSPGVVWQMTEKDNLSLTLPFSETEYTGTDNADSISRGGTFNWSHALNNQRASLLGQASYTNYYFNRTDGYTYQDVYSLLGGMQYQLSELLDVTGHVGLGHSRSHLTFNSQSDTSGASTYFSFDLAGTYRREKWEFTLKGDRQASPATTGEVTVRTRINLLASYFLTERLLVALSSSYFHSKSGGQASESETRTYALLPSIKYNWTENSSIRLEFQHLNNKNLLTDKVQRQNRTALRFEYRYPWFF